MSSPASLLRVRTAAAPTALLRIPPFPGAKVHRFEAIPGSPPPSDTALADATERMRELRVGGAYWAKQPELPESYVLVRSAAALSRCNELTKDRAEPLLWIEGQTAVAPQGRTVVGECDPWHMLAAAKALVCEAEDEVRAIAAILGVPTYVDFGGRLGPQKDDIAPLLSKFVLQASEFMNPFTGEPMSLLQAIELCGFWRGLIDSNRGIAGGVGFAFWKQESVAPLMWSGNGFRFLKSAPETPIGSIAIWRSKTSPALAESLDRRGLSLVEVEDGFLRSQGLGADCVPPLSITVDPRGPYFDHAQPSGLELLLQDDSFDEPLLARARRLRETIVAAGLGKYESGDTVLERPGGDRRHILVPGQVEDDRSVMTGGLGLSNLELLKRVRARESDAFLIYKPHPDVLAGHRKGSIPHEACSKLADGIVTDAPISSVIAMVDEVHVNTSLAGFEALMRGKKVTTYGVPFYAGWGVTEDFGPVPTRRTSRRTVDELVAATLLLYPRYLDPETGLPCPAETVVTRLCSAGKADAGLLVAVRRLQGRLKRRLRSLVA